MRCQLVGHTLGTCLFPDHLDIWSQCGQRTLDNVFGVPISLGYGRFIRFFFCLNAVFIMLHDAGTGFESRSAQGLHKSTFMGVERKRCWGHELCLALARAPTQPLGLDPVYRITRQPPHLPDSRAPKPSQSGRHLVFLD